METQKPLVRSLVPSALAQWCQAQGLPRFRADQLRLWLFEQGVLDWDHMSNVPKAVRQQLSTDFDLAGLEPIERQTSEDETRKFLFQLRDGHTIESVIIPMEDHATFCISTQVGCAMACRFCATGIGGLVRNLECGEIIEQVLRLQADLVESPRAGGCGKPFNIVFMGMGEPLDNWSAVSDSLSIFMNPDAMGISRRRIQISTSGPRHGLEQLIKDCPGVGLTLSLGGSTDEERLAVMPVPGRTPVREAVELVARYAGLIGRRATLAWVLIADKTDHLEMAARLGTLARGKPLKINLIPLNPLEDKTLAPSDHSRVLAFQRVLMDAGVDTYIRSSGGKDIAAACGQLRRQRLRKKRGPSK